MSVNNCKSTHNKLECRVPQGSILENMEHLQKYNEDLNITPSTQRKCTLPNLIDKYILGLMQKVYNCTTKYHKKVFALQIANTNAKHLNLRVQRAFSN